MVQVTIKNLPELISKSVGTNITVTSVDTKQLTAPGENFASLVLKVNVNLKNENGSSSVLQTVGKFLPTSGFFKDSPMIYTVFKNEIAFYKFIVPTLQQFQSEEGLKNHLVDMFPNVYGARMNLEGNSEKIDENAILLLEYLEGYTNVDRTIGYDLETAKLVLKNLACFHGVPLAMKIKKPEVFEKYIKPYCTNNAPSLSPEDEKKFYPTSFLLKLFEESEQFSSMLPIFKEKISNLKLNFMSPSHREQFATIVHRDMWINNCMIKFVNEKPVHCKLVDFQTIGYSSAANDLIYFLWTSVKKSVLEENLDDLIKFYHENFLDTLKTFGCDTAQFGLENFMEEIRIATEEGFIRTVFAMLCAVFAKKRNFDDEFESEPPNFDDLAKNLREKAKEEAVFMAEECIKRGWL